MGTYGKQKITIDAAEEKYRWIQSVNPMTATYSDVAAANITRITTGGYLTSDCGGIYKYSGSGKAYLAMNNGISSSDWWGAIGGYGLVSSTYLPGFKQDSTDDTAGQVINGCIDLFIRIDNATFTEPPNIKISRGAWYSREFKEI